jgi:hypothetical protein
MARRILTVGLPVVVYRIAIAIVIATILPWTQTLTNALTPVVTPITIAGVRCLVAPCTLFRTGTDRNDLDVPQSQSQPQPQPPPPLIIIPGMAQSLSMYEAHCNL